MLATEERLGDLSWLVVRGQAQAAFRTLSPSVGDRIRAVVRSLPALRELERFASVHRPRQTASLTLGDVFPGHARRQLRRRLAPLHRARARRREISAPNAKKLPNALIPLSVTRSGARRPRK
jgi:hypothetical protein